MNEPETDPYSPIAPIEDKTSFSLGTGSYILLFFLIILWPTASMMILMTGSGDYDFSQFDPVLFIYLPTIVIQWLIFLAVLLALRHEKSGFGSLWFKRPRLADFGNAFAFIFVSNIILFGIQFILALFGLTVSQNVNLIVEQAGDAVWWWLAVSVTAAVCEETAFRGYILTRVKKIWPQSWALPVLLSTLAFASGHAYQGWGGFILIFIYGLMFCALYLKTRSIWPGIIAHFIQDFAAIFVYQWFDV